MIPMLHLLKIEWLKVKHYKTFWIFIILYALGIVGVNYSGLYLHDLANKNVPMGEVLLGSPFTFPKIWSTAGYLNSWLLYFPGILFIMMFTNEFNFKTHRQNIIDGWKRSDFIRVKFVFAALFALAATLFIALTALVIGLIASPTFRWGGLDAILFTYLQTLAYITFAMLLAILLRRSGAAIAVFFLYGLIFEWIITALVNFNFGWTPVGYFLPLQVTDLLLPLPFGKEVLYGGAPSNWIMATAAVVYMALFYFFSLRKFQRDDL